MSESQLFISAIYKADLTEIYRVIRRASISTYKIKDSRGYSALHIASINSCENVVNFLIDYVKAI